MKRILSIVLLALAAVCCAPDMDYLENLPKEEETGQEGQTPGKDSLERIISVLPGGIVPEVRISIKESDWNRLLNAYNEDNSTQEYIPADASYSAGAVRESVIGAGLRLKGASSRRYPGEAGNLHHVHFGLHFSEYTKEAQMLGTSRLDLKWFKDDSAYCREVFCYDLFQRYGVWTAISAGYVRLWVKVGDKETYMGVYALMEHVKGDYVKHRQDLFGGKGGHLWKARSGASLRDPNAWMGADDNENDYTYELKTNKKDFETAQAELQTFIRNLNNLTGNEFYSWAEKTMDVPLLLRTYAVNVVVGMWDDYWNNTANYYFYFNPDGKFFFIPYDYDNTLGTCLAMGSQSDAGRQDPLHWGPDANPLISKLLRRPEWKALYISYMKELCSGDFKADVAMARIRDWHKVIGPYVSNDTGEDMEIKDQPAYWGNHHEYRILSSGTNNFFQVKASVVNAL